MLEVITVRKGNISRLVAEYLVGGFNTDKSKRRIVEFSGKVLTAKKSGCLFLGSFLIQPIILFLFILIFLLLEWIWLENAVGGSWAGQICPFLAKNSV